MPVQRGQIGKITFGWLSIPMIYAYFFYAFTTFLVIMVGRERIDILLNKSKRFDEYIYSIIFIIYLIPHFLYRMWVGESPMKFVIIKIVGELSNCIITR